MYTKPPPKNHRHCWMFRLPMILAFSLRSTVLEANQKRMSDQKIKKKKNDNDEENHDEEIQKEKTTHRGFLFRLIPLFNFLISSSQPVWQWRSKENRASLVHGYLTHTHHGFTDSKLFSFFLSIFVVVVVAHMFYSIAGWPVSSFNENTFGPPHLQ